MHINLSFKRMSLLNSDLKSSDLKMYLKEVKHKYETAKNGYNYSFENEIQPFLNYADKIAASIESISSDKYYNSDTKVKLSQQITEAYYKTPSTSDYNGIYRGRYIDFEVKETRNPTRFPFINIHEHQVEHMRECHKQGGIVFIIMRFHVHDEVFLYPIERFLVHWDNFKNKGGRKSIRYDDVKKESYQIPEKFNPRFDYLKTVDEIYFGER